jgi:UDP-glucose 4-epimerase
VHVTEGGDARILGHGRGAYAGSAVLVVGGSGFIGSSCTEALVTLGANVTVLNRRPDPYLPSRGLRQLSGDLRDGAFARAAVAGQDLVLDLLGTVPAVESNRDPERSLQEDCAPHLTLFRACSEARPQPTVVFPSSRLVYGRPLRLPVDESHPLAPQSLYAVHKIAVENYLRVFADTTGLPHVIFRISNPYGPGPEGRVRSHGILNRFIRQAVYGAPIRIFGDGAQVRDFIYLPDLVSTLLVAAVSPACRCRTFNVGGPAPISLAEAARVISSLCGGVPLEYVPWPLDARQVETGDYVSDTGRLAHHLGRISTTAFEEGVRATVAAQRAHDVEARSGRGS